VNVDPREAIGVLGMLAEEDPPAASPKDYFDQVSLVVAGTIEEFGNGRVYDGKKATDPGAVPTALVRVRVSDVVKGSVDQPILYIELTRNGWPIEEFTEAIPAGSQIVLYLNRAPLGGGELIIGEEEAEAPPGTQYWSPAGLKAMAIATGDVGVVLPLAGVALPDESCLTSYRISRPSAAAAIDP